MNGLRFGPAGCDEDYGGKVADIPEYLAGHGLDAFEVQCGHGVRMTKAGAEALRGSAERYGITLSVHAPYFISLTNPERLDGNIGYLRQSAALAGWLGARRIVVHTGSLMGLSREEALHLTGQSVKAVLDTAKAENWPDVLFCLETMGKINQMGTLEEVAELCGTDERLLPCVDFGHLYARSLGVFNGGGVFASALDTMESALGGRRARDCHIHFSRIAFSKGGESKHLTFDEGERMSAESMKTAASGLATAGGPDWAPLARLLRERGYRSTVICESRGTQTRDAVTMKRIYEEAGA
ncbi:MAG: TIM barrel protein [Oscillospiraceae bacterium]|jgi:deoxyribonuclease-4|nr:TIM barrel protein [Oscillospiraceae bacterium]